MSMVPARRLGTIQRRLPEREGTVRTPNEAPLLMLPKDLPVGRYHVFLRIMDGDKVISTGHWVAADL